VEIGDKKQKFFVHEALVSASSDFFKSSLKSEWKNNTTRSIALPDTDPVTFQIYLDWLYSGPHITITKKDDRVKPTPCATPSVDHEWIKWAACYELGSFLQDTDFKDALIDASMEKMYTDEEYTTDFPSFVYPTSSRQSPHRKLAVDIAVSVWHSTTLEDAAKKDLPGDFCADTMSIIGRTLRSGAAADIGIWNFFASVDPCKYHEHALSNTTCYKSKHGLDT
jgi:hypothetical protein